MAANPLGRRVPPDFEHVAKYPLSSSAAVALKPTPVVIGVNWLTAFDSPERDSAGHWWIGRSGDLGTVRGGHCVALKPRGVTDLTGWWDFYDQGTQGACVGFGCSRAMSLLNRRRYNGRWLWDRAKETDQWPDTNPGDDNGTSVRAGLGVLKERGPLIAGRSEPTLAEGIAAYRWIRSINDLLEVLGYQDKAYLDLLNSWGRDGYPHLVRMPVEVIERLWHEDGELGVITDL